MLDNALAIRNQIVTILRSAWSLPSDVDVLDRRERIPSDTFPKAWAKLSQIPRDFDGARSVSEVYEFSIGGAWSIGTGQDITALCVGYAASLGSALVAYDWSALGYLPQVTSVEFPDDDIEDPFYMVVLTFQITADIFQ